MKRPYKLRNWSEYNAALVKRGSLSLWLSDEVIAAWKNTRKTGNRGASKVYSDLAIQTLLTFKAIYGLALRQTIGFAGSIFELMGVSVDLPVHTTLSRRQKTLTIDLPTQPASGGRHVVVDSTGIKVYGEGEWKTRQHGVSKRRTWLKLHLGVDEQTGEILAAVVTTNKISDGTVLRDVLDQIPDDIDQVSADGAYDRCYCYDAIDEREATAAIPPRKDAKIWFHGNRKEEPHPRDENLRAIRKQGRSAWKEDSQYHRRSLSETMMYRVKTTFTGEVSARCIENQTTELLLECSILNRFTHLGMPDSYPVEG